MKKEQLLAEVEDVLRTAPPREPFNPFDDAVLPWLGRAAAVIQQWNVVYTPDFDRAARQLRAQAPTRDTQTGRHEAFSELMKLLYQARANLRMEVGQLSVVIQSGEAFDYFDEVRKVIETARTELFFVDPYLDAEFVSRYLPQASDGVAIRLLGGPKRIAALIPAVDLFAQQFKRTLQVRSSNGLHDRYLFVDRSACYLSGASFKDGAKSAPAVLTQITDAFQAMWDTYEGLWRTGKVERG